MKKLFLILFLSGCATHVIHPGTANTFDSDTYDTLLVTHNTIEQTKSALAANSFPASVAANVKTALNILIQAYDTADTLYCGAPISATGGGLQCVAGSYHASAMAGTATPSQTSGVSAAIAGVNNATSSLTTARAGN